MHHIISTTLHRENCQFAVGVPRGAVHDRLGDNRLGDRARAIGDHQCGGLGSEVISPGKHKQTNKHSWDHIETNSLAGAKPRQQRGVEIISGSAAYLGHGIGLASMHHLGG